MLTNTEGFPQTTNLSHAQIELLQQQIKEFKLLAKRFTDSSIPKLVDEHSFDQGPQGIFAAGIQAAPGQGGQGNTGGMLLPQQQQNPSFNPADKSLPRSTSHVVPGDSGKGSSVLPASGLSSFTQSGGDLNNPKQLQQQPQQPFLAPSKSISSSVADKDTSKLITGTKASSAASKASSANATKAATANVHQKAPPSSLPKAMGSVPLASSSSAAHTVPGAVPSTAAGTGTVPGAVPDAVPGTSVPAQPFSGPAGGAQAPAVAALSWQCFNSLLFFGPSGTSVENSSVQMPAEVGCFSKGINFPLVLTTPFTASLRDRIIGKVVQNAIRAREPAGSAPSMDTMTAQEKLWLLQRRTRAALANDYSAQLAKAGISAQFPSAHGQENYLAGLSFFRNFLRTRRQTKRYFRTWEREDKRKKAEVEDKKKKKQTELVKVVLAHRDDFFRYHKAKRAECAKIARTVKLNMEVADARKEKESARAEVKRLQALKENDMEAYMNLVQDTKNGRLKFLLNETDSYIATINRMIQEQRVAGGNLQPEAARAGGDNSATISASALESELEPPSDGAGSVLDVNKDSSKKSTQVTKDYLASAHKKVESVMQPTMLKGGDLKEYQMGGLQWLVSLYNNNLNGILADEMGLGKTIQTIALLCYLMEYKHNNGPFLVVVPLSTLSNWVNEFNKWAPDIIKVVYKGLREERKQIFKDQVENGQFNVLLTTYEYIMKDKSMLKRLVWQHVIVDEGHRMKNAQSKFAQTLGTVYQSRNRILLTGTPLQNNLPELWALLNFLLPTIFSSVDTFDQWFNKPFAAFRNQGPTSSAVAAAAVGGGEGAVEDAAALSEEERLLIVHRLHEVLRPFVLRRVKDQVLDQLPEKVEKVLRCNLSGWQRKMYSSISSKGLASKDKDKDGPSGAGLNNTIMQLRKVCNHPYLFVRDYMIDEDLVRASGKFELLDRMLPKLKAAGRRVLMFSQMVELMNFLEQFFYMRGFQYLRLDGNTTSDEREKRMYMFNDPDSPYFIFLLSTRAGGLGLNLATADTVIIFDSDWNPMMDAQAQDRAHRIGQKNEVKVFRLLSNSPIEERILASATDKRNLTGLVVEAGKFTNRAPNAEDKDNKEMMKSLLQEYTAGGSAAITESSVALPPMSEGGGLGGAEEQEDALDGIGSTEADSEVPDDEQINEMMAGSEAELALYQSMDVERTRRNLQRWEDMYRHRGEAVPPLPAPLMGAHERPTWLQESCWPTKYALLMHDMMAARKSSSSKKGGKKGRPAKAAPSVSFAVTTSTTSAAALAATVEDGEIIDDDDDGVATNNHNHESFISGAQLGNGDSGGISSESESESGDSAHMVAGKHMRKRKDVMYDDGMTENQFQRFIEKQQDAEESEAKAAKKALQQKSHPQLAGTGMGAGAGAGPGTVAPVFKDMQKVLRDLEKIVKPDGSLLTYFFKQMPDRAVFPDYYQMIPGPISLKEIALKMKKQTYRYFEEVATDFAMMSDNARVFNQDSSPVFFDCEQLRREFHRRAQPILAKHGLLLSGEGASDPFSSALSDPPDLPPRGYAIYTSSVDNRTPLLRNVNAHGDAPPRSAAGRAAGAKPGRKRSHAHAVAIDALGGELGQGAGSRVAVTQLPGAGSSRSQPAKKRAKIGASPVAAGAWEGGLGAESGENAAMSVFAPKKSYKRKPAAAAAAPAQGGEGWGADYSVNEGGVGAGLSESYHSQSLSLSLKRPVGAKRKPGANSAKGATNGGREEQLFLAISIPGRSKAPSLAGEGSSSSR